MKRKDIYIDMAFALLIMLTACTPVPHHVKQSREEAEIYPDYKDVTIPVNIAPMNFVVRGADAVEVKAGDLTIGSRGGHVEFGMREWRSLLEENDTIGVEVTALKNGQWIAYKRFYWYVVRDSIDSYLTYRLIEPGYSVWNRLQIKQRCVENFDEYALADYNLQSNRCMNCHTPGSQNPQLSMLYVRGNGGGAILNQNGRLRKLDIKTPDMVATSTYFQFAPSGRYIVFSSNDCFLYGKTFNPLMISCYHSQPNCSTRVVFHYKFCIYCINRISPINVYIIPQKNILPTTDH